MLPSQRLQLDHECSYPWSTSCQSSYRYHDPAMPANPYSVTYSNVPGTRYSRLKIWEKTCWSIMLRAIAQYCLILLLNTGVCRIASALSDSSLANIKLFTSCKLSLHLQQLRDPSLIHTGDYGGRGNFLGIWSSSTNASAPRCYKRYLDQGNMYKYYLPSGKTARTDTTWLCT